MPFGNCSNQECGKENVYLRKGLCLIHHVKQWRENNKEHFKQYSKNHKSQWHKDNPEYQITKNLERKNLLKGRTFPGDELALKNKIKEIRSLGLTVDHIRPLQGKTVSGLHVSWNLQGLTLIENSSKSNSYG